MDNREFMKRVVAILEKQQYALKKMAQESTMEPQHLSPSSPEKFDPNSMDMQEKLKLTRSKLNPKINGAIKTFILKGTSALDATIDVAFDANKISNLSDAQMQQLAETIKAAAKEVFKMEIKITWTAS